MHQSDNPLITAILCQCSSIMSNLYPDLGNLKQDSSFKMGEENAGKNFKCYIAWHMKTFGISQQKETIRVSNKLKNKYWRLIYFQTLQGGCLE